MIKYSSYFNLFIGIILLALSRNNQNSFDFLAILPILLFNWISLFHLLKNNLKFGSWHFYLGYTCIFLSVISIAANGILFTHLFFLKNTTIEFSFFLILIRLIFDISVVFQVITAIKVSKNLSLGLQEN